MDDTLNELQELFQKCETQTQKLTAPLLNNAIFISTEIDKLSEKLKVSGWTNGNQLSGEARAYNTLMGTFNTTIKNLYFILNDKMPDVPKSTNEAFAKIRNKAR